MIEMISKPWPWYIAGPLIGLTVPLLLFLGNKNFGLSSSLRHVCAACMPAKLPFFQYNWKNEIWNLFFVAGVLLGGFIAVQLLGNHQPIKIDAALQQSLASKGITQVDGLMPEQIFNWSQLLTLKGFIMIVVGGFLIGFGTRWGGGCTSGHAIMGLSSLQWPSLVATCCFMAGGFIMANFILPFILNL